KPKRLEDFPRFAVTAMRKHPPDAKGYTHFELDGRFDRLIDGIGDRWFWLLIGEKDCFTAQVKLLDQKALFDQETLVATLVGCEEEIPNMVGMTLFYLSSRWQCFHIWMVLYPKWRWERVLFQASDAVAEDFDSKDVSIIGGREVKRWTKLQRADKKGHQTRSYPAYDQAPGSGDAPKVIPGAWDHEHCELCGGHIDPGGVGYRDPNARWVCVDCHKKYVEPHDLSFVDEL